MGGCLGNFQDYRHSGNKSVTIKLNNEKNHNPAIFGLIFDGFGSKRYYIIETMGIFA